MSTALIVVLVSEAIALCLLVRIWKSGEHPFFKVTLTLLSVIPVLGPLLVIWLTNFPSIAPQVLQDRYRRSADVYDCWADTLSEKDPTKRFRKWRRIIHGERDGG